MAQAIPTIRGRWIIARARVSRTGRPVKGAPSPTKLEKGFNRCQASARGTMPKTLCSAKISAAVSSAMASVSCRIACPHGARLGGRTIWIARHARTAARRLKCQLMSSVRGVGQQQASAVKVDWHGPAERHWLSGGRHGGVGDRPRWVVATLPPDDPGPRAGSEEDRACLTSHWPVLPVHSRGTMNRELQAGLQGPCGHGWRGNGIES